MPTTVTDVPHGDLVFKQVGGTDRIVLAVRQLLTHMKGPLMPRDGGTQHGVEGQQGRGETACASGARGQLGHIVGVGAVSVELDHDLLS